MHRRSYFLITAAVTAFVGLAVCSALVSDPRDDLSRVPESQLAQSAAEPAPGPTRVGKEVCRECHAENHSLHAEHGHGSTFHRVSETELPQIFDGKSFDAGEAFGTYQYQADTEGNLSVTLPSQFGEEPFPLQYALGSGLHAQTMLTLAPGLDGQTEGIEHRITSYHDGHLGLTPGHGSKKPRGAFEYFGDSSRGQPLQRCVYCHTTSGRIEGEQIVDLVANVNCEKCHGPGSEHVRAARSSPNPPPYSVGRETWDAESEMQLCGDCHRLPRSVSEKEIRDYPDVLVRFQPIGLLRSECYLQSEGSLRCTTCHSPHTTITEMSVADHESKCIACHESDKETHVACPVSPASGCIECHMPAIELDGGLKFHDHWIRTFDR